MQLKLMSLLNYKKIFILVGLGLLLNIGLVANQASAGMGLLDRDTVSQEELDFKGAAGFSNAGEKTLATNVATIIKVFLGLLGIIFVVLIVAAGYQWFMAGGDAKKVEEAKDKITRAVIGLTIIVSAYAITFFVFNQLDSLGSVGGSSDGSVTQPSS